MGDFISAINLSTYTSPQIIEDKSKQWIGYGEDNNYYQYLIDLYLGSPTNNAAIKGIADLIFGQGLEVVRSDRHLQGYIEFKKLFHNDCLRNIAMDLKMLGQASFHVIKSKDKKRWAKVEHWPIQTLRPEKCNEDGEIEGYYYCADWTKLKRGQQPKRFAAWGHENPADTEAILVIRPYSTGSYYFAPVDYQGGTQWAELECEISNYHINNIKNGLAPSMLINFNNGQPSKEQKDAVEGQIANKWGGSSNAGKFIVSWNDSKDTAAEIMPVQLSDAHNQYQFLSGEAMAKIMVAHRITSPMLLGIKDSTGLGNNADELKSASILFDNIVIRPFQRLIIDGVDKILAANGIALEMYFKTLQPLEFTDLSGKAVDQATQEKEYGFSKVKTDLVHPYPKENHDDFISRCMPVVVGEGMEQDQAYEVCEHYWSVSTQLAKGDKISFDFDDTLSTKKGQDLAAKEIKDGSTVYVISARDSKDAILPIAEKLGISESRIFATGSNDAKIAKIKELGIIKHYDNNQDVIDALEGIGVKFKFDMSAEEESAWLDHLKKKGEIVNTDLWELVSEDEVTDPDGEYKFFKRFANPEEKSKDDKGVYLIRYRYAPLSAQINSRQFCKDMVSNGKLGVVYRREDIVQMGDDGINSQFAAKGEDTYSIWKYKGGVNCHHAWYRLTYRRKQINGKFIPLTPEEKADNVRLIDETYNRVSNQSADAAGVPFSPPDWNTAATKPINMPNKGRKN